jgi:type VI secretion system protein ImpF
MAVRDITFQPSVLDRLLDDTSGAAATRVRSRLQQLQELQNAVRRDLEDLLNTHRPWRSPPETMPELSSSLLEYGIPDFYAANTASANGREEFRGTVEEIIRRFEPRFKIVKVTIPDNTAADDRTMRFQIEALMYAEPAPERVTFDSLLDPASNNFAVVGGRDG